MSQTSKQFERPAERLLQTAEFIANRLPELPRVAIVLGSGLGNLVDYIMDPISIGYGEIPNWGRSTAAGHRGQLVYGRLESQPVIAMAGRFHRYEGWTNEDIAFPIRVFASIGCDTLIVSNAAGGLNPKYEVGDIVVIHDHIDLMHGRPGQRFAFGDSPPAFRSDAPKRGASPYDASLCSQALETARSCNFPAHPGTYLATLGPCYETRSEYRFFRKIGADVAGMSTVPEVLQAQRIGMRVLALSMVSNLAKPDAPIVASHDEVLEAGRKAEPRMRAIVQESIKRSSNAV